MIGIIDYGMSNLASLSNALLFLGIQHEVTAEAKSLNKYDKLILPGVGAFGQAMERLKQTGFSDALKQEMTKQKPLLGICLGMQLLFESSVEHGFHAGLGLIKGNVKFLGESVKTLPVPHVGWNSLKLKTPSTLLNPALTKAPPDDYSFYFVHSFYCDATDKAVVIGQVEYGIDFDVAVEAGHISGVQFHPEKSQKNGLKVLEAFNKL